MKAALVAATLLLPGAAAAETIRADAGEHPGFTRLVLDLPRPADWQLGRTADGYELQVKGRGLRYDLTDVFRVIPRTRLASIWADPETGNLRIGLACACHAVAFEHRPDILVIDLRDGPPETGSPVEAALDGRTMPKLVAARVSTVRPRPAPNRPFPPEAPPEPLAYVRPRPKPGFFAITGPDTDPTPPALPDWRSVLSQAAAPDTPEVPFAIPPQKRPSPDLDALRTQLLEGLGRAASAGVIDVDAPIFPEPEVPVAGTNAADLPGPHAHLAIDGLPGLDASPVNTDRAALTDQGDPCLPATALDIASWADDHPFDQQMSVARNQLIGEFDRPDPDKVAAFVRLTLHFGFGAEARNLMTVFPVDDKDTPVWLALSHVLDGDPAPPGGPLANQSACNGPSALWAALAAPDLAANRTIDRAAIMAAFSALPIHLRRHLGPGLAEKLLAAKDVATAQAIRDAIWRAPGDPGPAAHLADAHLDRARGRLPAAEETLAEVARQNGPVAARALVDLVDTRLAQGKAVDTGTITELAALAHENRNSALAPALIRAEMLARGSAGDFGTAFAMASDHQDSFATDLWHLLARSGPDSALLAQAILPAAAPRPAVDAATRRTIGDRLLRLGFPDEALRWFPTDADPADELRVAEAELSRGDARAALRGLAGQTGPGAERLRAAALARLGNQTAAATAFASAGDASAASAARWRAQDWAADADAAPEPRRMALQTLSPDAPLPAPDAAAPLAQGRALLEDSAKAREAILALLQTAPGPDTADP